jgi:hypothetical protein
MRTDLDHLPAAKQRDLDRAVQLIFEEFEAVRETATGPTSVARSSRLSSMPAMPAVAGLTSRILPSAMSRTSTFS